MESFLLLYSNDYLVLNAFDDVYDELLLTEDNKQKLYGVLENLVVYVSTFENKYKVTTAIPSFPGEDEIEVDTSDLLYVLKGTTRYYYDSNKELRFVVNISSTGEELVAKITGNLKDNTLVIEDYNFRYSYVRKGENLTQVRKIDKNRNIPATNVYYKVIEEPTNGVTRYSIIERLIANNHLVSKYVKVTKFKSGSVFVYTVTVDENILIDDYLYSVKGKEYAN
jgi:hypothetical protein